MSSRDNNSHSLSHRGAADDIKKGLQKIKLAQIQVLRQLRKDDSDGSRNHSLTYSKESTYDSKPVLKFDPEAALNKQKIQKLQADLKQYTLKQVKLKRQNNSLGEEIKKFKQISQRAEQKMKQYEKGEQKALAKAQQAISNAISSEKKFVTLKQEYDKTNKQRERLGNELKRLQKKQIGELLSQYQNQSQIINKIAKDLLLVQQYISQLNSQISSHKCFKKDAISNSNGKNANQFQSTNTFTVSTYETQQKLDKSINNIILNLNNLHTFAPIGSAGMRGGFSSENNNYLEGSFKEDIKNIQYELDKKSKEKLGEMESFKKTIEQKNKKIQSEVKQYRQQNVILKNKCKELTKQVEQIRISRKILEEQYERFKKKSKERQKLKEQEIEDIKIKNRSLIQLSRDKNVNSHKQIEINTEFLEDRIIDLEKQNNILLDQLSRAKNTEQSLKNIIQKLKVEIESGISAKKQLQGELNYQINKLKAKVDIQSHTNLKSQVEWDQMVRTIATLQQERTTVSMKQTQLNNRIMLSDQEHKSQIQKLEEELTNLRNQVDQLRKQNTTISFDMSQLTKLRNAQGSNKQSLNMNKKIEQLWGKKQGEYQNLNHVLGEIKPVQPHNVYQNPSPVIRNVVSQPYIISQQYPNNIIPNGYNQYQVQMPTAYIGPNIQNQGYYQPQQFTTPIHSYRMNHAPNNYIMR